LNHTLLKLPFCLIIICCLSVLNSLYSDAAVCNVRTKALGGAGSSLDDMPSCIYVNPASLVFSPYSSISLLYGNLNDGTNKGYAEFAYPFAQWATIAAGFDIYHTDSENYVQDYALALSLRIGENISCGVSASSIKNTISSYYDTSYGVGAGILVRPVRFLNVGIAGDNILTPEFSYEELGLQVEYTRDVRMGINIFQKEYFNIVSEVIAEDIGKAAGDTSYKASYGIEIYPHPTLAVRAGIKEDEWSIGAGIVSKNMKKISSIP